MRLEWDSKLSLYRIFWYHKIFQKKFLLLLYCFNGLYNPGNKKSNLAATLQKLKVIDFHWSQALSSLSQDPNFHFESIFRYEKIVLKNIFYCAASAVFIVWQVIQLLSRWTEWCALKTKRGSSRVVTEDRRRNISGTRSDSCEHLAMLYDRQQKYQNVQFHKWTGYRDQP